MANIRVYGENGRIKGINIDSKYLKNFNIIDNNDENNDCKTAGIRINMMNNASITLVDNLLCTDICMEKNAERLFTDINPELIKDVICKFLGIDDMINVIGGNEGFIRKAYPSIYEYISYVGCDSIKDITIHIGSNTIFDGGNYIEFPIDNNVIAAIHFDEKDKLFMVTISIGSPNANQYECNQTLAFIRKMKFVDVINQLF